MSSALLTRGTTFAFGSGFGRAPIMFKKDNGNLRIEGAAMFRSGTFRDSTGVQNTWEKIHLDQIVANYKHLRDSKILEDIPVRDGHKSWIIHDLPGNGQVVGYHSNLWTESLVAPHDGLTYDYLLADMDITDPAAAEKILNGTWRNRSAEISGYSTNAEAEFWPVYIGVAWVDIPAVEGLKFASSSTNAEQDRKVFVFMDNKETGVGTENANAGQTAPVKPAEQTLLGVSAPAQAFSINGGTVTDPVAVQQHITALEKFRSDTAEANRKEFVTSLAKDNKILATMVDSLTAFCLTLSDEQFGVWSKTYENAPVNPITANHGGGVSNADGSSQVGQIAAPTAAEQKIATDLEVVGMHKRTGTPTAKIKEMGSYKRLVAANKAPEL